MVVLPKDLEVQKGWHGLESAALVVPWLMASCHTITVFFYPLFFVSSGGAVMLGKHC